MEIAPYADPDDPTQNFISGSSSNQSAVSRLVSQVRRLWTIDKNHIIIMFSMLIQLILVIILFFMIVFVADPTQVLGGSQGIYNNLGYPPITDYCFRF